MSKKKLPPSKQLISTLARRRRRLLRLRRAAGILPPKPVEMLSERKEQKVDVLYFPSTHCDVLRTLQTSQNQDDTHAETKPSFNTSPTSITLFSLSPKASSPCKPSQSHLPNEFHEHTSAESSILQTTSPDLRVNPSAHSYSLYPKIGISRTQQNMCLETNNTHVKEEPSADFSYSISNVVTGRRVVDLGSILDKFEKIALHPIRCPKGRMIALSEDIDSQRSTIRFMCYECGQEAVLESDLFVVF